MTSPQRWLTQGALFRAGSTGTASAEALALLRAGSVPHALPDDVRGVTQERLAQAIGGGALVATAALEQALATSAHTGVSAGAASPALYAGSTVSATSSAAVNAGAGAAPLVTTSGAGALASGTGASLAAGSLAKGSLLAVVKTAALAASAPWVVAGTGLVAGGLALAIGLKQAQPPTPSPQAFENRVTQNAAAPMLPVSKQPRVDDNSSDDAPEAPPKSEPEQQTPAGATVGVFSPQRTAKEPKVTPTDTLMAEARDLARVRNISDPAQRLQQIRAHRAQFRAGQLGAESTLLEIQTLQATGDTLQACHLAHQFLLRHGRTGPHAASAERAAAACATSDGEGR